MTTGIIFSPKYLKHLTGTHVESPARLEAIMDAIHNNNLLESESFTLIEPTMATVDEILWVHDKEVIDKVKKVSQKARNGSLQALDYGDTILCEDSYDVSLLAAGGVMDAVDAVYDGKVQNAFALVRPPGHHANQFHSAGFCVFNNMAIMTEYILRKKDSKKVAIFDIDLHHGNGTADIFYDRDDVLFFSSHQDGRTQYPGSGFIDEIGEGKGKGYTINAPLVPGASDDVVQDIFKSVIKPVFEQFEPDVVLGSIGCDAHHSDPLSGLSFTFQGYGNYVKGFKDIADKYCDGKLILTLEGGYRVGNLAKCIVNILRVMAGEDMTYIEDNLVSGENVIVYNEKLIASMKEELKDYWKFD
ncbi:MAG: histone deacetylase family protein [Promethearchaeota archaeon]